MAVFTSFSVGGSGAEKRVCRAGTQRSREDSGRKQGKAFLAPLEAAAGAYSKTRIGVGMVYPDLRPWVNSMFG